MHRTRQRLRALLGVLAVLAVGVAVPAEAQQEGRLVLSGTGTAAVDLVLRTEGEVLPDGFRMQTRGTYAGLALLDARGDVLGVAMNVRTWVAGRADVAQAPVTTLLERTVLLPGRYRLVLLSDGPSTVSVRARGALVRSLRPTRPFQAQVRIADVAHPEGGPVNRAALPTDLRDSAFVLLAHHVETTALRAQVSEMCLTPPGGQVCRPTHDLGFTQVRRGSPTPGPGWHRDELSGSTFEEGFYDLRREWDARFGDAALDAPGRRYGLVVVL